MGSFVIEYSDETKDLVKIRNEMFPLMAGPLVLDRVRYKAMETLPRGVRYVHHWARSSSMITIVYEEEPTMRLIMFNGKEYYIPTPWVVYFLSVQNNRMWVDRIAYNTESIKSVDQVLKIPVLPNIYLDTSMFCKVCPASEAMTLLEVREGKIRYDITMGSAIASFWASYFNNDILAYEAYLPMVYIGNDLTGFERFTAENICELPWAPSASIKGLLSQMEYGTSLTSPERIGKTTTTVKSLYAELHSSAMLDTFDEIIPGKAREDHSGDDEESDVDEDGICQCEECREGRGVL